MFAWIAGNWITLVVTAVILVLAGAAVFSLVKDRKSGRGGCTGNCASCGMCCSCGKKQNP